ncbi:MAG: BON domain-containing protein [Vicinamibacterales bacterium]
MTTASLTGTDVRLRDAIIRQLDWDPEVDDSAVGVAAKDGTVTLTGYIDSYAGKLAAERAVKRVRGVRAVANDIVVRVKVDRTDADIAADAARALKLHPGISETIQATVHNGHVTLTGRVEWLVQRDRAEEVVQHIRSVRGIQNHIEVSPKTTQRDVRRRIVQTLHHNAELDARLIDVAIGDDDAVILTGTVRSWSQRDAAERAAGSAPGIRRVDNRLIVETPEPYEVEPPDEIC